MGDHGFYRWEPRRAFLARLIFAVTVSRRGMTDVSGCVILTSCCGTVCTVSTAHGGVCVILVYDQVCSPTGFFGGSAVAVSSLSFANSCISHSLS